MLLDNIFGFPRTPVQRTYNWDCIMPDIWGAGVLGIAVSKYCQDISFGNYNIDDIVEMNVGALKKFFAGRMNIPNPQLSVIAPVPDIVSNYFHTWKNLIIEDNVYYHKASDYKKNIYVMLYDRTGVPSNMITLVGAFPKTFPSWKLSYSDENVVKYDIELKVDDIGTGLSSFGSFVGEAKEAIGNTLESINNLF
jgi:hypothetical protein